MNPEDNNPLINPGAPNLGMPADPVDPINSVPSPTAPLATNPMDPMAGSPASDTTTGANQNMGIENTIEEPLVPAAPVPGSIGSVTSVPPVDPATTPAPFAPAGPTQAAPAMPDQAAQAPYNPFAQPAAQAGVENPAPAPAVGLNGAPAPAAPAAPATAPTTPPPVQPTNAPKSAKSAVRMSPMIIVLAIVAVLGVVMAIIFAALYIGAKNDQKVVYVPSTADDTANAAVEVLSCSRENDFNYLIGYDHEVIGSQDVMLNYTGDKLDSIALSASATFDNESDANVAKDNYANAAVIRESMTANYQVEGSTMTAGFGVADGNTLSDVDAAAIIYGDGTEGADLSLPAVQAHYESIGYTCTQE